MIQLSPTSKEFEKFDGISLIVPVYNEALSIAQFCQSVTCALKGLCNFEIVFINDGSRDDTERTIESIMHDDSLFPITLVNLSRNFGKEAALASGMQRARGEAVIPMDVDLQDPPELIPEMIEKWKAGAKIVNARRIDRSEDSFFKRTSAKIFYYIYNTMTEYPIPKNVGDFRLLDRVVVESILTIGERSRFNKGIFNWVGYETSEVTFSRPNRDTGSSKWSCWKLIKLALDGLFTSSTLPLRIWTYLGLTMVFLSMIYGLIIFFTTLIFGRDVPGYASTVLLILTFGALNMIALGIMGEYIGRIYEEVRQRPLYIIRSINRTF
ncbi:glycosyltransferase family 2 protein [Shewanella sp. SR44-4]|uniref:glycosyltransferase family 2 protein n=1 Tax=Shewanella sp. SR44-4 TaxID=2760935 RepID=UPI0016046BB5|nr:glycosyltransferase family 2 protein [Shewanella sp. SR44-4]MBB1361929.1 glycosyltransferase family 2 protein [Shewanella sp. SR44-4]